MAAAFNPLLPEHQRDPYPGYRALRAEEPVHWSPLLEGWVLTRHADVAAVLRDPRFKVGRGDGELIRGSPFPMVRPELRPVVDALTHTLLFTDPPVHTRLRALVARAFTARLVDGHGARIQALVDDLLDAIEEQGRLDLVRDLALPLPLTVIAEVLGVPTADRGELNRWSEDVGEPLDPFVSPEAFERAQASALEMYAYFREVFAARRRRPHEDLVSALIAAGDLDEVELFALCALLIGAGHLTTTNFLGNAVHAILAHPDERRRLADDPGLIGSALEECLRYESPVQMTARVAGERVVLGGRTVVAGDFLVLLLGAANRDPAAFPDPDRLDLGRRGHEHLAFSSGIHACLGARLARLEGRVAVATLLRRFPDLELIDGPPAWKPVVVSRGLVTLPLAFTPSARAAARP